MNEGRKIKRHTAEREHVFFYLYYHNDLLRIEYDCHVQWHTIFQRFVNISVTYRQVYDYSDVIHTYVFLSLI